MRNKNAFSLLVMMILLVGVLTACGGNDSSASSEEEPVTLTIYTMAGGDEYYKDVIIPAFEEEYAGQYNVEYGRGSAQEVINKLKAQGENGNIDLVISGLDGIPLGMEQDIWEPILPEYSEEVHAEQWNEIGTAYGEKFEGFAVPIKTEGGPILVYNKDNVENPPTNYEDLKTWIMDNPGKFTYPAVPSSGTGRGFFFGLTQAMGEDFNNPESLDKTWSYLEEIAPNIDNYPSKTSASFDALYEGTVDIVPHLPLWYANLQKEGTVPPNIGAVMLEDTKQIVDAHFYAMIKDLPEERKEAAVKFLEFATTPEMQSMGIPDTFVPVNTEASKDFLSDERKEEYDQLMEAMLPEFKDGEEIVMPEWILYPDVDATVESYSNWEEKIQSQK